MIATHQLLKAMAAPARPVMIVPNCRRGAHSLAAISCLSKDHFIRLFKKEVGNTPLQYINQKKIEKAQLILITEDIPVKNIAYLLAYEDHSYFNRLFKKITGVTPQQYRELYKK